jgi:hypothetical protein
LTLHAETPTDRKRLTAQLDRQQLHRDCPANVSNGRFTAKWQTQRRLLLIPEEGQANGLILDWSHPLQKSYP